MNGADSRRRANRKARPTPRVGLDGSLITRYSTELPLEHLERVAPLGVHPQRRDLPNTASLVGTTETIETFVYPNAYAEHLTWASILLFLLTRGGGPWSLDKTLGLEPEAQR